MIKKLALLAAAGLLYVAAPTAPASAQGVTVRVGNGGGYHHHHGGWRRDNGWRHGRAYGPRHGYYRGGRTKTIIVR
jgi:hypothetical protein